VARLPVAGEKVFGREEDLEFLHGLGRFPGPDR
jgi:hypothetical protein